MHRADAADALCSAAFARAAALQAAASGLPGGHEPTEVALVAVGGYGRRELAPHSDLDVVLVHADGADVDVLAAQLWYPLWDSGHVIDHAVRALSEVAEAAAKDVRVALGLLDVRHLAGDSALTLRLRSTVLAQWRRSARTRLPELQDMVRRRVERTGELAHASVPDLKESGGGLRDTTVLRALVASWLVDVPHVELERSRRTLLEVRDALHAVAGRASDRVAPELWPDLSRRLGHGDVAETQRQVREVGRRTTHISRLTWRRVDDLLAPRPTRVARSGPPPLVPLGHGLAETAGEVVLTTGATPGPDTLLRAAAEAAERDLVLSPHTVARLLRDGGVPPEPWPAPARELLVRLLAAGDGLLPVWETLDETGALTRLLPEWEGVRLLPHASVVHRFTVDRHLVETCIEASRLLRRVGRPDLLVLAALLHDIGKGGLRDHSVAGAPVAAAVARRLGFPEPDVAVLTTLVRHHLLLVEAATTRDLEDAATLDHVLARVDDPATLDLLVVLTEADARATAAKAWTPWRASLVGDLAARVRAALATGRGATYDAGTGGAPEEGEDHVPVPQQVLADPTVVHVAVRTGEDGSEVTVVTGDRVGLLAAVSGALGLMRVPIRAARAWTQGEHAVSRWHVDAVDLDAAALRTQVEAVLAGRTDPRRRLARAAGLTPDPSVALRPDASRSATVLEVRTEDRPGVVHLVCAALSGQGLVVRSAHVATVGPQAVDVFYVQEEGAGALGEERAASAAHAVRAALTGPVTLDV